jgi:phosphomannomutase / phosphoglucomutase
VQDAIFREYDIRGKVGSELIIDHIYDLTLSIAWYFKKHAPLATTVAVGMDGRSHSEAIKDEVCRALVDSGFSVLFFGVCSTPALYFGLHTLPVHAGIMVTASHNPKEYNGLKLSIGTATIWGTQIAYIKDLYHQKKNILQPDRQGVVYVYDINNAYIDWLIDHFAPLKNRYMPIVIDCGNATASTVLPQLIEKMQWTGVQLLCAELDSTFSKHEADPTVEKNMYEVRNALATTNDAVCGIGFDGDADRMAAMTTDGTLLPGDKLLTLFALQMLKAYPQLSLVADIKSSEMLLQLLSLRGAHVHLSPSGHAIIKNNMKEYKALLGGELSGHFYFADRYFGYDDGIYAMMRLLELLDNTGKTLTQLLAVLPVTHSSREYRISYDEHLRGTIIETIKNAFVHRADAHMLSIDGIRVVLSYGWAIVRASNTQPVLCIRFESDTAAGLIQLKEEFMTLLNPFFDKAVLYSEFFPERNH